MSTGTHTHFFARAAAALAAFGCAGCLALRLDRDTRLERLPDAAVSELVPGTTDLTAALERLGPPLYAWELAGDGVALAWGWYRSGGWQLRLSLPDSGNGESLYVDYGQAADRMRGAALFFDSALVLTAVREGLLRDIRVESRPRPADVEDEAAGGG